MLLDGSGSPADDETTTVTDPVPGLTWIVQGVPEATAPRAQLVTNGLSGDTEQLLPAGTELVSTDPEGSVKVMVRVVAVAVCGPLLVTVAASGNGPIPRLIDTARSADDGGADVVVVPAVGIVVVEPELRWVVPGDPEPDGPGPVKDFDPLVSVRDFPLVFVVDDAVPTALVVACVRLGADVEVAELMAAIP